MQIRSFFVNKDKQRKDYIQSVSVIYLIKILAELSVFISSLSWITRFSDSIVGYPSPISNPEEYALLQDITILSIIVCMFNVGIWIAHTLKTKKYTFPKKENEKKLEGINRKFSLHNTTK